MKNSIRIALFAIIVLSIASFFYFDLQYYVSLEYLKSQQHAFQDYYAQNKVLCIGIFVFLYIFTTALSLPGASPLTLLGGALFGLWPAVFMVSFSSTIGATLAFLVARFLLRDFFEKKFGKYLEKINKGIHSEGAFYLFTIRMIPLFPFFIVNIVMSLTKMQIWRFYWVSQIGMLLGTFVYVNAGTQLGKIETAAGILSPKVILSFVLLGLFPLITKKLIVPILKKVFSQSTPGGTNV